MDKERMDDERLSAWVDGEYESDPQEQARIETWLREHPVEAQRVQQWVRDRDLLRARWAPVLDEALPARLRETALGRGSNQGTRWARAAMAASLLVGGALIGSVVTWRWQSEASASRAVASSSGWEQRALLAHAVYVPEPRHAVEVKAQEDHLARWLTRRIEAPVKLFDLRDFGFELVGGRLLPDGAGKSAQLMYQDAKGVRVTVYLRKPDDGTEAAFHYQRKDKLGMFFWVESGAGYALVGDLPREQLLALAQAIYKQQSVTGSAP